MFEYNGMQFTLEQVTAAAKEWGLSLEEYLEKYGIKRVLESSEDFQQPTFPGADVEQTTAPDMDYTSEDTSLALALEHLKNAGVNTEPKKSKFKLPSMSPFYALDEPMDWDHLGDELFKPIEQGIVSGWAGAKATGVTHDVMEGDTSLETAEEFVDAINTFNNAPQIEKINKWSTAFDKYRADGESIFMSTLLASGDEGIMGLMGVVVQSAARGLNKEAAVAGLKTGIPAAAAGAGASWYFGGAGAIPAGFLGFMAGQNKMVEQVAVFQEHIQDALRERGKAFTGENVRELLLNEPEVVDEIKRISKDRAIKIATTELAFNMVGIKGAGALTKTARASRKGVARAGGQALIGTSEVAGGMVGEIRGLKAEGKEIDEKEVVLEGIAGLSTSPITATLGAYGMKGDMGIYKVDGEVVPKSVAEQYNKLRNSGFDVNIEALNDPEFEAEIKSKTDLLSVEKNIDPSVTDSADIAALTALELQRLNLANKDSKSAKNRIKEIDEAITKITDKYTITGELKKEPVSEKNQKIADKNEELTETLTSEYSSPEQKEKAKRDLYENNKGLIQDEVNKRYDPTLDTDVTRADVESEVTLKFAEAMNEYKADKGPFGAWAKFVIGKRMPASWDTLVETKINEETGKKEIVGKQDITDKQIEGEVTIQKDPNLENKTQIKKKLFTKKLGFDKSVIEGEFITDEKTGKKKPKTFADVFVDAVAKTFGTKLPAVTDKNFVKEFSKNNIAELMPFIRNLTKIDRKKGIDKFKPFIVKNWKSVLDQLPPSVINKKYDMLRKPVLKETGKQKREATAEGKGEFEYLGMDRKDFVDYFTNKNPDVIATAAGEITFKNDQGVKSKLRITSKNGKGFIGKRLGDKITVDGQQVELTKIEVGSSTLSDRRTSLLETLINELSADAAVKVVQDEKIMSKFKDVQEIQGQEVPKDFLDVIVEALDRGIEHLNDLQKGNGELRSSLGFPELAISAVKTFMQVASKTLKATKSIAKAIEAGIKEAQKLFDTKAEKQAVKEVLQEKGEKLLKSKPEERTAIVEEVVEEVDKKNVYEKNKDTFDAKLKELKSIPVKERKDALINFLKYEFKTYLNNAGFFGGQANKIGFDYLVKEGIIPKSLLPKGKQKAGKIYFENSKIKYGRLDKNGKLKAETLHNPIDLTRPKTFRGKFFKKGSSKFLGFREYLKLLKKEKYNIDNQSTENKGFVANIAIKMIQQGKIKQLDNILALMGTYSESPLRLMGVVRSIQKGVKIPAYEHSPSIKDIRDSIMEIARNYKKGDNLVETYNKIREKLDESYVDIIEESVKDKLKPTGGFGKKYKKGGDSIYRLEEQGGLNVKEDIVYLKDEMEDVNELNDFFNNMLEETTGLDASERVSEAHARVMGRKAEKFKIWIPETADDFLGLLYPWAGKGKVGEGHLKWIKEKLTNVFSEQMIIYDAKKQEAQDKLEAAQKRIKEAGVDLGKEAVLGYSNDQAIRIFLWRSQGLESLLIEQGLTESELKEVSKYVRENLNIIEYAEEINNIYPDKLLPAPEPGWLATTITKDFLNHFNGVIRKEHLKPFWHNINAILGKFDPRTGKLSGEGTNKLRKLFGNTYIKALENTLYRIHTGRNRSYELDQQGNRIVEWWNNAVGNIMFLNKRSSILQQLSIINFMNWKDNNPAQAAMAFANQKQFWSDFSMIFNSSYLKQRRSGLKTDINEQEIATAAATSTNKAEAAISAILKKGYILTQMGDSFAIAFGGAGFYRNRFNTYKKQGLSDAEAHEKTFAEFRDISETTQQSARVDKISMEQASLAGRFILNFQNTPMQYNRIAKKAWLDFKNRRGSDRENISKIVLYVGFNNLLFNGLQQGLFALLFNEDRDDGEETNISEKQRYFNLANGMADSVLRGSGMRGAFIATAKNLVFEILEQERKDDPDVIAERKEKGLKQQQKDWTDIVGKMTAISPPLNYKFQQIMKPEYAYESKKERERVKEMGIDPRNPAVIAAADVLSVTMNIPVNRVLRKIEHVRTALGEEVEAWQAIALMLGWGKWELEVKDKKDDKEDPVEIKTRKSKDRELKQRGLKRRGLD